MTCRHTAGDRDCSSHPDNVAARQYEYEQQKKETARKEKEARDKEIYAMTPDAERYQIIEVERVGPHLVMNVLYPNCTKCSYEGHKVMVFLNVTESQVLKWREIDPHFRDPAKAGNPRQAPGPSARFPASKEGWEDAISYARSKK